MTERSAGLPLDGIRVLDAAHVIAGPGIAARLSDFGADVIKIENPRGGDTTRQLGWTVGGYTLWWKLLGRNKRSVTLNLSAERGQEILAELAQSVDVLVEAFRPGTMERWNLGPDRLCEINPKLVYVRVSGFGQSGPYAARPGFGTLAEAMSGFVHMNGFPGQPPVLPPIALADEVAALFGCYAVMLALYHRNVHGGSGQVVDISLVESLFNLLGPLCLVYDKLGTVVGPTGGRMPYAAPRGAYLTSDGRWLALSGTAQTVAMRVLKAIGRPELMDDERFSTNEARVCNVDELDRLIAEWVGQWRLEEALEIFEANEVAAAPVLDVAQAIEDPQFQARKAIERIADDDLEEVTVPSVQPLLSSTPGRISRLGGPLGEFTDQVLAEELGMSPEQILELHEDGIV